MSRNTQINRKIILKVARALGSMNDQIVYVGGATVSLYINDPAAEDVRPTKDLDISLSLASLSELELTREKLIMLGFIQSAEDDVICRFRYEDILVDVMNTKAIGWAPANPWFAPGFERKEHYTIDDITIQILPLPYFLASKFSAFLDRGKKDARTSHDFEDIVYILDNRTDILDQLITAPDEVKCFLREQIQEIINSARLLEALEGHLEFESRAERLKRIVGILSDFAQY